MKARFLVYVLCSVFFIAGSNAFGQETTKKVDKKVEHTTVVKTDSAKKALKPMRSHKHRRASTTKKTEVTKKTEETKK